MRFAYAAIIALVAAVFLPYSAAAAQVSDGYNVAAARADAERQLVALGINLGDATFQIGARNYAGPNCPGAGWNCTSTATAVVQIGNSTVASAINSVQCYSNPSGSAPGPGSCTIIQTSATGTNDARCIEYSNQNNATQSCIITQTNVAGKNSAIVGQLIDQAQGTAGATTSQSQTGDQNAEVTQTNVSGQNVSTIGQAIGQRIQGKDTDQEASQNAYVCQGGNPCYTDTLMTGANVAWVVQGLSQVASTTRGGAIQQDQQTDGGSGVSADITQKSLTGQNESHLNQPQSLLAQIGGERDRDGHDSHDSDSLVAASTSQNQGNIFSGIHGSVTQSSTGLSTIDARQDERQTMQAPAGTLQEQVGPVFCCSPQGSNPSDRFNIVQSSSQFARATATQIDALDGNCQSSGTPAPNGCHISQTLNQNGTVTQSPPCSPAESQSCNRLTAEGCGGETEPSCFPD